LTREATGYATTVPGYNNSAAEDTSHGIAHNIVLVNGLGPVGWHYHEAGPPTIRRLESQPAYAYADVSLTDYYQIAADHPEYANPALVSLEREYVFVRALESMVILDRIQVQSPDGERTPATEVKGTLALHFENTPTVEDPTHLLVVNGDQALHLTTLLPTAGGTYRQLSEPSSFVVRTELDYAGGSSSACNSDKSCIYFLSVLQARDAAAANLAASAVDSRPADPTTGTFTVTLHPSTGGDTLIVFQKGMESFGGSITVNGTQKDLRNDVQSISYTEDGPVWKS
jgi:hypothetical protein